MNHNVECNGLDSSISQSITTGLCLERSPLLDDVLDMPQHEPPFLDVSSPLSRRLVCFGFDGPALDAQ